MPRLSRRIVPGCKINLNLYWTKFEEDEQQHSTIITIRSPSKGPMSRLVAVNESTSELPLSDSLSSN